MLTFIISFTFLVFLQAVLEKQSYMLIGRHDIEQLMRLDPASAYLPNAFGQSNIETHASDAESYEVELELSELLLNLPPIKQVSFYFSDYMFSAFFLFLVKGSKMSDLNCLHVLLVLKLLMKL